LKKSEKYSKQHLSVELSLIQTTGRVKELPMIDIYEKAIIYKYSNDGYEVLNEELRNNGGQNNSEFGILLERCLNKLPNYQGLVYRGVFLTENEFKKYSHAMQNSVLVTETTFVSTTKSRLLAMEFGTTLFRIISKSGKEIEKIATFGIYSPPSEQEVLFKPNRSFRVLEIINDLITLEEI
jgi:hypothetical protein